jgi:ATP-dependent Clp protease adapter protein ClpS
MIVNADTQVETAVEDLTAIRLDLPWRLLLFNDNIHTFEEVIVQLMKAVHTSVEQAQAWAWEVHTRGKACVLEASFEECFRANAVLLEIQLVTQIEG